VPASRFDASGREGGREEMLSIINAELKKDVLGGKNSNKGGKRK